MIGRWGRGMGEGRKGEGHTACTGQVRCGYGLAFDSQGTCCALGVVEDAADVDVLGEEEGGENGEGEGGVVHF